ncbi:uncharacterized protein LOC131221804 [Magnolia sinica]|uniref:uncharacterized protein LOC131221804 n=1 Tax=Magnolia sinica TaxID=86752 RepID=UPI00265A33BC|nr:uncharacterized protein LOC131221804 [Magnolia sinica]
MSTVETLLRLPRCLYAILTVYKVITTEEIAGKIASFRSFSTGSLQVSSNLLRGFARGILFPLDYSSLQLRSSLEILSSLWRGWCSPFKLHRGCPIISHLLFTDDTLLFVNGSQDSLHSIKAFLVAFQEVTGQRINFHKSSFLCSAKMNTGRIRQIERALGISKARAGVLYLCIPLFKGRVSTASFKVLIDKTGSRISGWNARLLSQAGRLTLIKHVLGSIPLHTMAATKIPVNLVTKLECRFAQFFWGWAEGKKKVQWIAWNKISHPIDEGGLGVRKLQEVLKALRRKMAWKVKYGQVVSPWVLYMRARQQTDLEEGSSAGPSSSVSPFWKKVRNELPILANTVQWQVGDGDMNLWTSNWTGLGPLQSLVPSPIPQALLSLKVKDYTGLAGPCPPSSVNLLLVDDLHNLIVSSGFATFEDPPSCFWPLDATGKFSTKSAWHLSRDTGQGL